MLFLRYHIAKQCARDSIFKDEIRQMKISRIKECLIRVCGMKQGQKLLCRRRGQMIGRDDSHFENDRIGLKNENNTLWRSIAMNDKISVTIFVIWQEPPLTK